MQPSPVVSQSLIVSVPLSTLSADHLQEADLLELDEIEL